jgi:acetylglutamate kinase
MMLVHGGGPEINSWLARIGVQPQFINGLRVTDALTMEVVEMVLVGKVFLTFMAFISLLFYF